MDKTAIGFLADVLYIKGVIYYDEFEAIQECKNPSDLQDIVEGMLTNKFNGYKRGEAYVGYEEGSQRSFRKAGEIECPCPTCTSAD